MNSSANATRRSGYQAILLVILATGFFNTAHGAKQIYFQLDGADISSETVSEAWNGWIAGRAFGQAYECKTSQDEGGVVRAVPQLTRSFQVVRFLDKASPKLAEALSEGRMFPKLTAVYLREFTPENEDAVRIVLENVEVTSLRVSTDDLGRLTEEVAFAFSDAQFRYGDSRDPSPGSGPQEHSNAIHDVRGMDSDGDGLPDAFEKAYSLESSEEDLDGDGLTNGEEFAGGSAPDDRRSRFGIDRITLMRDKPGRGLVSFRALPGRHYRLMGSPTGQKWFELDSFSSSADGEAFQQEIELPLNGLTQLLRIEVSIKR